MNSLTKSKVFEIGCVPWTVEDIQNEYEEFKNIYANKPVHDNAGGMKAPHAFACWFMLRKLKPQLIIESGVWKGQGTWLIEQACPDAELICLDIDLSRLVYKSKFATYFEKDFSLVDFSGYEKSNSLCFFDDHQNALTRLQQLRWKGFSRAIFEDNYPKLRGDCYSLKKMLGEHGFQKEKAPKSLKILTKSLLRSALGTNNSEYIPPNFTHKAEICENLRVYYEFPPLFKEEHTRWGDKWDFENYPTKEPILDSQRKDELRAESKHYNWMCYVEVK